MWARYEQAGVSRSCLPVWSAQEWKGDPLRPFSTLPVSASLSVIAQASFERVSALIANTGVDEARRYAAARRVRSAGASVRSKNWMKFS
jgi:hypothetical protein